MAQQEQPTLGCVDLVINYFSNPDPNVQFHGYDVGNDDANNAEIIRQNMVRHIYIYTSVMIAPPAFKGRGGHN